MTTFDRFDPFERRIGEALDGLAPVRQLDYLDDVFRQTARSPQRPRWSFPERWLNVDTTLPRPMLFGRSVQWRMLLVLAMLLAVLATTAFYFGTQKRLPAPYGPADNGQIVFGSNGDLYVVDALGAQPRLLLAAPGEQGAVANSPDGQLIAYDNVVDGVDTVWVAESDGSKPRQVLATPFTGESFAWAPDSRSMAIVTKAPRYELWIAQADGSGAKLVEFESLGVLEARWDPQRQNVLLVRAFDRTTDSVDLFFVDTTGQVLSRIDLTGLDLNGIVYEFSGIDIAPDGRTIAYNSIEAEEAPVNRFRVHLIDRDGTNDRAIPSPLTTGYSQAWPIFSPDGTLVAMESWETQPNGNAINQIAIAPVDGSAAARWVGPRMPGQSLVKAWSPDGTRVLMSVVDEEEVYAIDPVTGQYELLPWAADLPDWQRLAR